MRKGPEAAFQDSVVEYLRTRGWLVMAIAPGSVRRGRIVTNMRYDGNGWPDLTCIKDGRIVFIECKSRGVRKLRPDQTKWALAIMRVESITDAVEHHVFNPIDWDRIERIFA